MIKTLNKLGIEGTYLNLIKAVYDRLTANLIVSQGNWAFVFLLKSAREQDAHSFYSFRLFLQVLARVIRGRNKGKKPNCLVCR